MTFLLSILGYLFGSDNGTGLREDESLEEDEEDEEDEALDGI